MKSLALMLALTCATAAVMAGYSAPSSPVYSGPSGSPYGAAGGSLYRPGNRREDDVDVRATPVEGFKGKVQDLNICECDATNGFVSVTAGKIGEDTNGAFIEFCFVLDNPNFASCPSGALNPSNLGAALDLHGACDNCNDLLSIQQNGVVTFDSGCSLDKQHLKGTLKVYLRDGFFNSVTTADTLEQVAERTNGRFFAQTFLVELGTDGNIVRRLGCATVTGTITPKSCEANKWGVGQNNICAGTQCSRGVKQRLGRAVAQAKTFDCCDDTDVFGCCSAAGKSDPSTCSSLHTHHHCGPDAWGTDLSTTFSIAKQRNFFTAPKSNWAGFDTTDFGNAAFGQSGPRGNTGRSASFDNDFGGGDNDRFANRFDDRNDDRVDRHPGRG